MRHDDDKGNVLPRANDSVWNTVLIRWDPPGRPPYMAELLRQLAGRPERDDGL